MDGIKKRGDSSIVTVVFGCRRANIRDKIEGEVMADEVAALSFRIDALALLCGRVDASDEDDEKETVVLDTIAMMMTMTMAADLVLGRRLVIAFAVFMGEHSQDDSR